LEDNNRWGKGVLINRLLLFLGSLGALILLAGFLFSRGDRAISTAQAENQAHSRVETAGAYRADSLMQTTDGSQTSPKSK